MAFDANNLLLHIKRAVYSSVGLGYQSVCDYPTVLGASILLLFLHKLCPSLFAFLLSSSPVFLLTSLLLGALLSYGEPSAPAIREETLGKQQTLPPKSNISITDCSIEEAENVTVNVHVAKRFGSQVIYTEERTFDGILKGFHHDEQNMTTVSADTVLCAESSEISKTNVIVDREDVKEICEKVELQQFEITDTERCHYELNNQYQFGELMSSCWQPVMRQDPCSDSESDLTESSSDASITDIIPMLDELNPPVNLEANHPSSTPRDNLHSSSDDDEDESEEDGDLSSNEDGAEEKKDDGNNGKDFMDLNSSDTEKNGNLESLMERRRAKNIMKFELDRRLMDMQAADAIQKMEEATRFCVQVPSISTPRPSPFDPLDGSDETIELPQIPDSAPSVLLPWRKPFDIPFDQILDHERQLPGTWTPCSYFPSTQRSKHGNLYVGQSTYLRHHNGIKPEKPEVGEKDASVRHSDSDYEEARNNGKLFGSLEPHIGDEIKMLSAAISDACVLEVNYGTNEGTKSTDSINGTDSFYIQKSISSMSEANDSVSAGSERSLLRSLSEEYNMEQHIIEADAIGEVNSLFKCRMEEVLVQSISESGIGQPLTGELEDELSGTLSSDSDIPVIEASSVEALYSQYVQLNEEALTCASSYSTRDNESIQERTSEALPAENGYSSKLSIEDEHLTDTTLGEAMSVKVQVKPQDAEIPFLEASSTAERNPVFRQLEEEVQAQMPRSSEHKFGQHNGEAGSGVLVSGA